MKSDESKIVLRYGLYKYIGEEIGVKKKYKKTWTQNTLPTKFFGFLIGYHSETTPPRVKILPPVDFLGSKYSFTKFSSRTQNFQIFALSLFFYHSRYIKKYFSFLLNLIIVKFTYRRIIWKKSFLSVGACSSELCFI